MCTCVKKVREKFLEKMKLEKGFTGVIKEPDFVNKSCYPTVIPYFIIVGRYEQKNRIRKYEISLYPIYCPFCGEKLNKKTEL